MQRAILFLAAALFMLSATGTASGLTRPLSQVVRAVREANPSLHPTTARGWAKVIRDEARKHQFDPYTLIAIVHGETNFNPSAINNNPPREYSVGLSQINVLSFRACRPSDTMLQSPGCQAIISRLLVGDHNLRTAAGIITSARDYCRRRTGQPALFARWLSVFQGYDSRPGVVCNMRRDSRGHWRDLPVPVLTRRVMAYRRHLQLTIGR